MRVTNYLLTGMILQVRTGELTPQIYPNVLIPQKHKGLVAGLLKGNQWFISPDHKAPEHEIRKA